MYKVNEGLISNIWNKITTPEEDKYISGDFGYYWTVTKGNEDIENSIIDEYIDVSDAGLTSLRGAPKEAKGFNCSDNNLISLEFSPEIINGDFNCSSNKLKSLEYGPKTVNGNYVCTLNKLQNLQGSPRSTKGFYCEYNKLSTLVGAPDMVDEFRCQNNRLSDLVFLPQIVNEDLHAEHNLLETFKGCQSKIKGRIIIHQNLNKYLEEEYHIRNKHSDYSEGEIQDLLFKQTRNREFLSDEANEILM